MFKRYLLLPVNREKWRLLSEKDKHDALEGFGFDLSKEIIESDRLLEYNMKEIIQIQEE